MFKNRKKLLLISAAALLIIGGAAAFALSRRDDQSAEQPDNGGQTINYGPATEEEKKQAEDNKDRIVKEQENAANNPQPSGSNKKAVTPTITNTSNNVVNAYISGVFEDGGTCTATFTKDSTQLSKTSQGFENVSYTQCAPINVDPGFLSSGTWKVSIMYSSATAEGTSDSQNMVVQ